MMATLKEFQGHALFTLSMKTKSVKFNLFSPEKKYTSNIDELFTIPNVLPEKEVQIYFYFYDRK